MIDCEGHVQVHGLADGLPIVHGLDRGKALSIGLDRIGDVQEDLGSDRGVDRLPCRECLPCGGHRRIHILLGGFGAFCELLPVRGVIDGELPAV